MSKASFEDMFIRIFYGFWLLVWTYSIFEPIVFHRITEARFIDDLFSPYIITIPRHFSLMVLASLVLAPLLLPRSYWARGLGFLGILGASMIALPDENCVWSYLNIWIYSSLWFVFSGRGWFSFEKALLTIQLQWSTIMLVSGLHKIKTLFVAGHDLPLSLIMQYTTANIFIDKVTISPVGMWFMLSPTFAAFSWVAGIMLEIGIFVVFIFCENKIFAGALCIIFHIMTMLTFRVHYMDTAIGLTTIFILGGAFLSAQKETAVVRFQSFRPFLKFKC